MNKFKEEMIKRSWTSYDDNEFFNPYTPDGTTELVGFNPEENFYFWEKTIEIRGRVGVDKKTFKSLQAFLMFIDNL